MFAASDGTHRHQQNVCEKVCDKYTQLCHASVFLKITDEKSCKLSISSVHPGRSGGGFLTNRKGQTMVIHVQESKADVDMLPTSFPNMLLMQKSQ